MELLENPKKFGGVGKAGEIPKKKIWGFGGKSAEKNGVPDMGPVNSGSGMMILEPSPSPILMAYEIGDTTEDGMLSNIYVHAC